ncbi:Leucine Rich Repeat family protein [Trichomonas vaginalis G3]|uniref:Leucine Rich Repeat family protein n=1 Tax=Trichomonas vaginalis (strain ATCC PRA-98 / G3) TaxID=412133 RepID=A2G1H8_TRIV3|nr:uncharacterized protein TVAGG3_0486120 [Trichomonas vaginalis G3]EAX88992.1 Leucine Rich Repeat family protein [Trichomonas vaginalis G3]KAI5516049.1 axoneme assembly [Trichomonas vaginalis G3]|eukprot:XP_001301922.1 hypothetical protein [Trichomonas vaginalis G3]
MSVEIKDPLILTKQNIKDISTVKIGQVESLIIDHNLLESISNIPKNEKLKFFSASWNKIEVINEDDLNSILNIKELDLSNNLISKIENINQLKSLETLNVSSNRIEVLENVEQLNKLSKIIAPENRIHTVFIKNPLPALEYLDLSFNPISEFNYHQIFPNLKTLILNNCYLTNFLSLSSFKSLTKLSLSHNKITDEADLELPNLISLNISNNNIIDFQSLSKLQNLEFLNASYNPIDNDSFTSKGKFEKISILILSGTKVTKLDLILSKFPNVENLDIKETSGYSEDDFISFISKIKTLSSIDVRGVFYEIPTDTRFSSFAEFQANFHGDLSKYIEFRKRVLEVVKNRPFLFDGIEVQNETEDYTVIQTPKSNKHHGIPQTEVKKPKKEQPLHSFDDVYAGKNAKQILIKLLEENKKLAEKLGLEPRNIDVEKLSDEEIIKLIREISEENDNMRRSIGNNEQFNDKCEIVRKLLRHNEKMQAYLENRERKNIEMPNLNQSNIDPFICDLIDRNRILRAQYEKMIHINDVTLIEKCEIKILERARKAMLPEEPTIIIKGSRHYNTVHQWLNLKITRDFNLKKLVKLATFRDFIIASEKYKWMQLVVSFPSNENYLLVTDNFLFLNPGKYSFILYALDSGKQIVDYTHYNSTNKLKIPTKQSYDTLLTTVDDQQVIYVQNMDRIVPLYSFSIKVY